MKIRIPYADTHMELLIEDRFVKGVLTPNAFCDRSSLSQAQIVKKALDEPIASVPLRKMAGQARHVLLITSDHTRPLPSFVTLPILLHEIRQGRQDIEITILIATGFHRETTRAEMIQKFGMGVVQNEIIVNHDSRKSSDMVYKGRLPSGAPLLLNKRVEEADLVIAEGFIEPHIFAGYSGGRKSILPGIASQETVFSNHCSEFLDHPKAVAGQMSGNPIHLDMMYAAKAAGLRFIMNVLLDENKKIRAAFAGDPMKAHEAGCAMLQNEVMLKPITADIVITSNGGYPLDQNVYQTAKGLQSAAACVKKGGVMIMVAECKDGHGGEDFYKQLTSTDDMHILLEKIRSVPMQKTTADQWQVQLFARIMQKAHIIMVAQPKAQSMIERMHMRYAGDLQTALCMARDILDQEASVTIIPDGVSVVVDGSM